MIYKKQKLILHQEKHKILYINKKPIIFNVYYGNITNTNSR